MPDARIDSKSSPASSPPARQQAVAPEAHADIDLSNVRFKDGDLSPLFMADRKFPQGSRMDTLADNGFEHANTIRFLRSREILQVHLAPQQFERHLRDELSNDILYGVDDLGKHVLQQVGFRGCIGATVQMLALDRGLEADPRQIHDATIGQLKWSQSHIESQGARTIYTPLLASELRNILPGLLERHGSAILSVGGELGGHVIIVDRIDLPSETARIRDPHHGWSISVKLSAIERRLTPETDVLQIERNENKLLEIAARRAEALKPPTIFQSVRRWLGR